MHIETRQSRTVHGARYEVANGAVIPNLGEKSFVGVCFGNGGRGVARQFVAQVADVNKALLSVGRLEQAGYQVQFGGPGRSWIRDGNTGERLPLEKVGQCYMLNLWVKTGFTGQERR